MSFTQNRFGALLGDEETEIDKLGNVKPVEKKNDAQTPNRREQRRAATGTRQPAVSPPSRRDRGNRKDVSEPAAVSAEGASKPARPERAGRNEFNGRGRQFDRHSATGKHDTEKKITQGWGEAGTAEFQGARDVLDPNDPDAAETRNSNTEEQEENTKTLDEYLAEKNNGQNFRLNEARKANEGADDGQWKGAVVLEKNDDVFFAGKESEAKLKLKVKKEKIFLEIDQPAHRSNDDRRGDDRRGGRGGRGGRRGGRGGNNSRGAGNKSNGRSQASVNLSDSKAFPILGA